MTDEQKVFIRGVAGRGDEVIKMLEDRGGKAALSNLGGKPSYIYFISHEGNINCALYESEAGKIIMDNYRELHLPEQWEDGDVLISVESNERFAVYASACYTRDDACCCYMYADDECDEIDTEDCNILRRFYRLATPSEIEHFHELMHKHGKDWDAEKKQVVDWQWKPQKKEGVYIGARWADEHPKSPWISVKDRLPQHEHSVMIALADGTYSTGYLIHDIIDDERYWDVDCFESFVEVNDNDYWMPIPELNKSENQ